MAAVMEIGSVAVAVESNVSEVDSNEETFEAPQPVLGRWRLPGVGLVQNATRAKPNAFHFKRQVAILQRAGGGTAERQFKAASFSLHSLEDSAIFDNFPQTLTQITSSELYILYIDICSGVRKVQY